MIYNLTASQYLACHPRWALGFWERSCGMIGRRFIPGELDAMIFPKCSLIHTCWMKIPIDAVFINKEFKVTALKRNLLPWRIAYGGIHATAVIELPSGKIDETATKIGDLLNLNQILSPEQVEKFTAGVILEKGYTC